MKFTPLRAIGLLVLVTAVFLGIRISMDRRAAEEHRLKSERQTKELLEQREAEIQRIKDDFERKMRERDLNEQLYGTSEPPPEVVQRQIEEHLRRIAESNSSPRP